MSRHIQHVELVGPAGPLESQLMLPDVPRPGAALVCHPHPQHGGTMHTKAVHRVARGFEAAGVPVLRFNFRGVGRSAGSYTAGAGERDDTRAALAWLVRHHAGEPLLVAGFSFGAWVGLEVGCEFPAVVGLLGVAPPLELYDFGFLERTSLPVLCVAGDRDPFCPRDALDALVTRLGGRAEAVVFEGGEHLLTTHLAPLAAAVTRFAAARLAAVGAPGAGRRDRPPGL